jgi:hypothetical protein
MAMACRELVESAQALVALNTSDATLELIEVGLKVIVLYGTLLKVVILHGAFHDDA